MHPDRDVPDPRPGIELGPEHPERAFAGRVREPGEAERCSQEKAALVEHALLDHLVGSLQDGLRDRQP
jgi:hypothetical protein